VYSQVLYACIDLNLFERLASGPRTTSDLARLLGLPEPGALRLLKAAETLGLVERAGPDRFALGELGAALLGNPGVAEMVRHHAMLYRDLADPVALLKGIRGPTNLGSYWAYAGEGRPETLNGDRTRDYSDLMGVSQRLLDIGGGNGAFLSAAGARWPDLKLALFDLPPVAEQARARFEREGLADRAEAVGGDLFADPLPRGADCCSLIRVVHDHDDGPALAILKAARAALEPGGALILAEPMSGTPGAEPIGEAYFGFYLLAMGSGRPRTPGELIAMLDAAGFSGAGLRPTRRPLLTRLIVAKA
jgi:demethylspheroidene O-methyltransferase